MVSVDPYELLTEARLEAWRELLAGVDILFLSEDELEVSGALDDPKSILKELAPGPPEPTRGLRLVALKRGARGGLLWDAHDKAFLEWSGRAAEVVDPTGAGDAFAGGFLAGQLRGEPISRALAQGVVSASFALEGLGADGLLAATPDEAESRRRDWFES